MPNGSDATRQIPPRAPGDDVILRVRVRRQNVPLLEAGVDVHGFRLVAMPDDVHELAIRGPADPHAFVDGPTGGQPS